MRIENRRVVNRRQFNKAIVEDDKKGLILTDSNLNLLNNLGFEEFRLLDFAPNGHIILLKSKNWLTIRNANKTTITAFDIETKQHLFSTDKFLGYRSIIDKSSNYFLLEYYSGLCCVNIKNGEVVFKKDKIDKNLYNADLHLKSNIVYIPTEKKSILRYHFDDHYFDEIKLENVGGMSWIKFDNTQTYLLVSDKKNSLHCFTHDNFVKPIWTTNFSKLKKDNRICCYNIITTESNLACIHGFMPSSDQTAYAGGTLYIFDIPSGEIIDSLDYANIQEEIITDFQEDEIIIDDLRSLSLKTKTFRQTPIASHIYTRTESI
ncbi:hypothetical protein [uncultured Sphingobacterium sp.]|uniref:hypothetical protein n=1 Tax=uncultured Sphingobacterium sp. TaxID=182688 RepID=UPI0037495E17